MELQQCLHARGRTQPFKKHLQDSLPVSSEGTQPGPRSRGGSSEHQHSSLLTPTGLILLQALRAEQSRAELLHLLANITQTSGSHGTWALTGRALGATAMGSGHSRTTPLMAKLPNKRVLV